MKKNTFTITPDLAKEWKEKHGTFYKIEAETGEVCYIFDPVSSIKVMAGAVKAMNESPIAYVQTILNNCFLGGDEEMKSSEQIQLGLVDMINEITDLPELDIVKDGSKYIAKGFGFEIQLKPVTRENIIFAEKRNSERRPFKTNEYILEKVVLPGIEALDEIRKNDKAFLALIMSVEKIKDKKIVKIEKF